MSPIKLFYSYSIHDEKYREELEKSLTLLKRFEYLEEWHFRRIPPGQNIDSAIKEELENSDIILLLVSRDFLASNYCYDIELKRAIELHENNQAEVIPIILRECDWRHEKSPIKKLKALPKDGLPIVEWPNVDRAFQDITEGLKVAISQLKERKRQQSLPQKPPTVDSNSSVDDVDSDTIRKALEVFLQEKDRISYNSSMEEVEKFQKLRGELFNSLICGEIDQKIKNTPSLKEKVPHALFSKIYTAEKLDDFTIIEIGKIRDDKSTYLWHERKLVVSALTLSLISFKKFDPKKAHILLDFITDFENMVCENALTGLVLALIYHKNKWERFSDLKQRLERLRELENIQAGLWQIERILMRKLYKGSLFDSTIFNSPFFNSPVNCFLPFYKNNPVLQHALENNESNIDPDNFSEYVERLPFLDSHKYSLCIALEKGTAREVKLNKEERDKVFRSLSIADDYAPYQNILSELYCFFTYYPSDKIDDVFKEQLSITKTKLKTIILDKVHELQLTAEILIQEENLHEAIRNFTDLLAIEPTNRAALWGISQCFSRSKRPDFKSAIRHLLVLYNAEKKKNIKTIVELAYCHRSIGKYDQALEYGFRAKELDPENYSVLIAIGITYEKLEDYPRALEICLEGLNVYPNDSLLLIKAGGLYEEAKNYYKAIEFFQKALDYCEKDDLEDVYAHMATCFVELEDNPNAIKYSELALSCDNKSPDALMNIGRVYFIGNIDLKTSRKYLERSLAIQKTNVCYGNLGHVELCAGNENQAIEFYKQSAVLFEKISDFIKKYNVDLPYIKKYGVSEEKYDQIRELWSIIGIHLKFKWVF